MKQVDNAVILLEPEDQFTLRGILGIVKQVPLVREKFLNFFMKKLLIV